MSGYSAPSQHVADTQGVGMMDIEHERFDPHVSEVAPVIYSARNSSGVSAYERGVIGTRARRASRSCEHQSCFPDAIRLGVNIC